MGYYILCLWNDIHTRYGVYFISELKKCKCGIQKKRKFSGGKNAAVPLQKNENML